MLTLEQALEVVDEDLPDGAWMAMLCDLTGMDAGEVANGLYAIEKRRRREWRNNNERGK
jgi:hypothetical protein